MILYQPAVPAREQPLLARRIGNSNQFREREDWFAGNGCAALGIGCRRGSAGTTGGPIGAPRLVGGGAGGGTP
jgi:hypothetical protein